MVVLGADHGGFGLKEAIKAYLEEKGIEYRISVRTAKTRWIMHRLHLQWQKRLFREKQKKESFAAGTGIGISIAANKVKGIRAAVCTNEFCAEMTRRHNDSNILCMGGRVISEEMAVKLADIFLHTDFEGGRHARRIGQIAEIENSQL